MRLSSYLKTTESLELPDLLPLQILIGVETCLESETGLNKKHHDGHGRSETCCVWGLSRSELPECGVVSLALQLIGYLEEH